MMAALKKERIALRMSECEKETLEQAAFLSNTSVSSFVLEIAAVRAREIISERKRLMVAEQQWDAVMDALQSPEEATPLMKQIIGNSMEETWTVKINK